MHTFLQKSNIAQLLDDIQQRLAHLEAIILCEQLKESTLESPIWMPSEFTAALEASLQSAESHLAEVGAAEACQRLDGQVETCRQLKLECAQLEKEAHDMRLNGDVGGEIHVERKLHANWLRMVRFYGIHFDRASIKYGFYAGVGLERATMWRLLPLYCCVLVGEFTVADFGHLAINT